MLRTFATLALVALFVAVFAPFAAAQDFDPYLHPKAQDYTDWLIQWHSTGLGGVSDILFTDETRTAIERTWGTGDSGDWTATYLVAQSIRYIVTGEQQARDEVIRIGNYLHILHDITGDPGYIARYAALDEPPWNIEYGPDADFKHLGEGEYEGYFWLGHQSRDKYITWFWGLSWAYDAIEDDPEVRAMILEDMREMVLTLESNDWFIIDPWGQMYSAAEIGPDLRLSILAQAARIIDEPYFRELLDAEYERWKNLLWIRSIAFFNLYYEYYAFINNYSNAQPFFRYWPDRERALHLFKIWRVNARTWSQGGHNPFFDSVYYGACKRFGVCDEAELTAIEADAYESLVDMNEAPNWQRHEDIRQDLPLDPFSVWAFDILEANPWIRDLFGINIEPQVLPAREISDRCWESVLWERSPHIMECDDIDMPAHVTHGVDYLIGYWLGVYYGVLPGPGPFPDPPLEEPTDDDDNDDDDNDDDDDDNNDDDNDDDNNDDNNDDNDDVADDDDDDDNDSGCGC